MHGTTMMFLFAVPVMEAMAVYLVPLMLGTRNIAFARLNAFCTGSTSPAGRMLWVAFLLNVGPGCRLVLLRAAVGPGIFAGQARRHLGADDHLHRGRGAGGGGRDGHDHPQAARAGHELARMPLFAWAMLVVALMIIFAMPSVALASAHADVATGWSARNSSTQLRARRSPALAAPLLVLRPSRGLHHLPARDRLRLARSSQTFSGRPIFGYPAIVLALVAHRAARLRPVGPPHVRDRPAAPGLCLLHRREHGGRRSRPGIQIFCWIATIWDGRPRFAVPMLWVVGFIVTFVIGGLTGVMLASVPLDLQLHDTYFVVAHFHYVLIGGAVFPLLGAITYWFPKITGRLMSRGLGKLELLARLPRLPARRSSRCTSSACWACRGGSTPIRPGMGWDGLNLVATIGAFAPRARASLLFVVNVLVSLRRGAVGRADNPWDASGLEWATASPPPPYNFAHMPVVAEPHAAVGRTASACPCMTASGSTSARCCSPPWSTRCPTSASRRRAVDLAARLGAGDRPRCSSARSSRPGRWSSARCR